MAHKNVLHIATASLLLAGCGASATARVVGQTPDGHAQVLITCTRQMNACYQKAADVCLHGFTVANESGQAGPAVAQTHCDAFGNCYSTAAQRFDGTLIVACNHSPAIEQAKAK